LLLFFCIMRKLKKNFFQREAITVAKELLGKVLFTNIDNKLTGGIIVEVEAYSGFDDPANHGFKGKTKRNEPIFYEGGIVYVYLNYGIHHLLNIVVDKRDFPASVFIRALEPLVGIEIMMERRKIKDVKNLTNGPAKLTKALGIDMSFNKEDIDSEKIFISEENYIKNFEIIKTSRIGISRGKSLLRRFFIKNNKFVSKGYS